MKKIISHAALAFVLGTTAAGAQAGLLTYQGVTFSSTWDANVLTLEIDAANHTGDWSSAQALQGLSIKGIGNYTGVSVTATSKGTSGWTTSNAELDANGCAGTTSGNGKGKEQSQSQGGSSVCFFGNQVALSDDMVFTFAFSGTGVLADDPHVKVQFVDATGKKAGSLLSQDLLPGTLTRSSSDSVAAATALNAPAPADTSTSTNVPEPWSIALLLGGLAAMFMVRQRARRGH